jgi:hypothetical protein
VRGGALQEDGLSTPRYAIAAGGARVLKKLRIE